MWKLLQLLSEDTYQFKKRYNKFLKDLDWEKLWLLPNTAGSQTAEEAIRMAFLGHELACQLGQPDNFLN
jgi:thiazole synthase ThiGH ThiG subunit